MEGQSSPRASMYLASQNTSAKPVAQSINEELKGSLEGDQDQVKSGRPNYPLVNATLEESPPGTSACRGDSSSLSSLEFSSVEVSDDGSIFEEIGDQGTGEVSHLCAYCQYIFDNWSEGFNDCNFRYPHHENISELEKAADGGCALCVQFLKSQEDSEIQQAKDEMGELGQGGFDSPGVSALTWRNYLYQSNKAAVAGERLHIDLPFLRPTDSDAEDDDEGSDNFDREIIRFQVDMIPAWLPAAIHRPGNDLLANTRDSLALGSRWLKRCRKSHWQCNNPREQLIPSRLISTEESHARILLSTDFQSPPEYATLSHCWGHAEFMTLKRSNMEIFRKRIPQEALSKTFKDSIIIARRLGFLYIWIDSLCIIQDDPDDWTRESALMSSVYGCSGLNIAASGAVDGSCGCFFERPSTWRCQVQIEAENHLLRYECIPSGMYYRSLSTMPLVRRGWALQERLLAPRTLHITSTQLFWECHQKVACETFPEEFPTSIAYSSCYFKKQPISRSMWSWIVHRYSGCDLTYTKDKLVAISGLARNIQLQTCDQYIAGMWRKDLEFQLCWYNSVGQSVRRVVPYRAPTWSWASLDCLIDFSIAERFQNTRENTHVWIRVLDIDLQFSGLDPLGQLSMANLCLSCSCLVHVTFQFGDRNDYMIVGGSYIKLIVHFDCPPEADDARLHGCFAMPVFGSFETTTITGLFLEPTKQRRGQYRRLGQFRIHKEKHSKAFETASAEPSCRAESAEFSRIRKDKYGKTHYIINVI